MKGIFKKVVSVFFVGYLSSVGAMLPLEESSVKAGSLQTNPCGLQEISPYAEISRPDVTITKEDIEGAYTTFFLFRHAPTRKNVDDIIQGTSAEGGADLILDDKFAKYLQLKNIPFAGLYASDSTRAVSTIKFLGGMTEGSCVFSWLFNEQRLGRLEGTKRSDVFRDPDFRFMLKSPDYRIPESSTGISAETGKEVINRMLLGVSKVAAGNIGETVGICSSQCAMNWFFRWTSGNFEKVLQIENYGVILFRYYTEANVIKLLTVDGAIPPQEAIMLYTSAK